MSGILQTLFLGAAAAVTDAYFNLTTLLLNTSSTNGAQNNTFLDSSTNNFTIPRNGNTTQGTFTPFSQTGWSNYFNGSSDYLSAASNAAFAVGANTNFTIEAWIYLTSAASSNVIYQTRINGGLTIGFNSGALFVAHDGVSNVISYTYTPPTNTWIHVAAVRNGTAASNTVLYINGVQVATASDNTAYAQGGIYIGYNQQVPGWYFPGYISNLRFVNGSAVYTSAFTPSTTPLTAITNTQLLTCQSNRFLDSSTNAFAITASGTPSVQAFSPFAPTAAYDTAVVGGSGYFDGSGDYLLNTTNNLQIASSTNFTVEFWVYNLVSSTGGQGKCIFAIGTEATNRIQFTLYGTAARVEVYSGALDFSGGTVPLNAWTHIAVVRSGSTMTIYVNGTSVATATYTAVIGNNPSFIVGANRSISDYYNGYISGLRLLNGTAQYTANFTPPTAPPTAITNTSLLLNYTNSGIYDSTAKNVLETVSTAQVSTTQAKWGTTSIAFNGTTGYLKPYYPAPAEGTNFSFGKGDFTVEFWMYPTSTPANSMIMDGRGSGASGDLWLITWVSGVIGWYSGSPLINSSAVSANVWTHVAICRSGTSTKMFLNGTQTGSTYSDTKNYTVGNGWPTIGASYNAVEFFAGYMDDIRVTKGFARYTANFTAPTAAFPLQ